MGLVVESSSKDRLTVADISKEGKYGEEGTLIIYISKAAPYEVYRQG